MKRMPLTFTIMAALVAGLLTSGFAESSADAKSDQKEIVKLKKDITLDTKDMTNDSVTIKNDKLTVKTDYQAYLDARAKFGPNSAEAKEARETLNRDRLALRKAEIDFRKDAKDLRKDRREATREQNEIKGDEGRAHEKADIEHPERTERPELHERVDVNAHASEDVRRK